MGILISCDPEQLRNDFDAGVDAFVTFFTIFKKNYPERISKLNEYITAGSDYNLMYGIAHTIKGSVSYFRMDELTKVCIQMEDSIKSQDMEKIKNHFLIYKENLDYFLRVISDYLETL